MLRELRRLSVLKMLKDACREYIRNEWWLDVRTDIFTVSQGVEEINRLRGTL